MTTRTQRAFHFASLMIRYDKTRDASLGWTPSSHKQ